MQTEFTPPRQIGVLLQGSLILILGGAGAWFFFRSTQAPSGLEFMLQMLIALILFSPLPFLIYRLYALLGAVYILRREGLMIRWGLRREDIPLRQIDWIRPASELGFRLPLPWLRLPGGIIGTRKVSELGLVEFMAADVKHMVLIATPEIIFAISPQQTSSFMTAFQRVSELGSLSHLEAQSLHPKVLLGRVWEDRIARILILTSLGIGLILLITITIAIPSLETITWTKPGETAPPERLLLLPVLNAIILIVNFILGLFYFRTGGDSRIAAYLIWGNATLSGLLLLVGSLLLIF